MAEQCFLETLECDIEQAITALKKGAQLLKYGCRGKPKFCLFRLSNDETLLIWYFGREENKLWLNTVSRIVPGESTAIFQRYPWPEMEYQSFSLIHGNEERSVDVSNFFDGRSIGGSMHLGTSDVGSDSVAVHTRLGGGSQTDNSRISMSSAVSSSSHGSGHEEGSLGAVLLWGEGIGDGVLGGGERRVGIPGDIKLDALLPKPLEAAVVLDVQNISCGGRHAALESGGQLGHGVDCDVSHPQLVEALAASNIEFVSCGQYHSCAVTLSGDLYTWGDGTHNSGLLGHGNNISHWTPKWVYGLLEGMKVSSISCGHWHTALVTSTGQLFTFGDGTFGVLGHGDRKSMYAPREVESLKRLKTVQAACGVWHTAAVVEVMVGYSNASTCMSGKLFTWGDGDKGRLGHGDKEQHLVPTCVAALVDHNFRQVACGYSLTIALTTAGQVFTMGSTTYGQLGDPEADGKLPGLVEGRLWEAYVEEIVCGAYHVAVLTHKTEVYTWDTQDRSTPTLVEALKGKQVKSIACGASFTAAICRHKWLSGADQRVCLGCRQPFGFIRKQHNCYNCSAVFCHACSSKKALKASLAPNPNRPYCVCEPCLIKLKRAAESGVTVGPLSRRWSPKFQEPPPSKSAMIFEAVKHIDRKPLCCSCTSVVSPLPSWSTVDVPTGFNSEFQATNSSIPKLKIASSYSVPSPRAVSRAVSPLSRRLSPPRATIPTPTISGLTVTKAVVEDLKKTSATLSAENMSFRSQIESLSHQLLNQEKELQHSSQQLQNAIAMAAEEAIKSRAAKEVIKSLTAQLKEWADRFPKGASRHGRSVSRSAGHPDMPNDSHLMATADMVQQPDGKGAPLLPCKYNVGMATKNVHDVDANGVISPHEGGRTVESSFSSQNERETETEWVEQDDPGVYITLTTLSDGGRDLKRVRLRYQKPFSEREAEQW
ncbi:hypothetical protein BDL97_08G069500 [Sphagnum fallax]|nr:hypothetical protein BDL97_08G069500 [Sphagnum fallax]